ncbi:hypothetical protein [Kitasatospora camelliae]|uniref:Transposase n=1 Tax=Kitasatospora camelliae TaxID=3156397 RepID=A0AAU8JQT2_9ACTN
MSDFETIADELYGLPPTGFTEARNTASDRARKAGDRALAKRVGALRRPTLGAWAVNLLARTRPEEVEPFLALGRSLREAQAALAGPELRELSARRQQLVAALTARARAVAAEAGERLGEPQLREVEQTLRAALADERAAEAVAAGRLTTALDTTADLPAAVGVARPPEPRTRPAPARPAGRRAAARTKAEPDATTDAEADARAAAEAEVRETEARETEARAALVEAERAAVGAESALRRLEQRADRLAAAREKAAGQAERAREALRQAEDRLAGARSAEEEVRVERERAARQVADARSRVESAHERLDRPSAPDGGPDGVPDREPYEEGAG